MTFWCRRCSEQSRRVGEDLDLDVAGPLHGLLEEHPGVAEGAPRLAHRLGESRRELPRGLHAAHAPTAAAGDRLDEDREADVLGLAEQDVDVVGGLGRAEHGNAGSDGMRLGRDLVARHLENGCRRPDERDPVGGGLLGQLGVLRKEAVARVDGVRAGFEGDTDDLVDVEVGADGVPDLADLVRLVGLQPVEGVAVLVREHRDRAGSQLERRAEGADRDLSTIGHQDLAEHSTSER